MEKNAFIEAVRAAGIVGEGGAGFPTHVKYAAKAETVIANGCECEPLLHTDQYHMLHEALEIVRALETLKETTGAKRAVIGVKRKYKEVTQKLSEAIHAAGSSIELALLDNFYPAGDEQILVREVTGKSVPPLGLPIAVGAIVSNVGTLVSVSEAMNGIPFTQKSLTITGEVANSGLVTAPLGTPLMACLEAAGSVRVQDPVFILGGPMMGRLVDSWDKLASEVVTKTSGGLIVLPRGHYLHKNATQSIEHMRRRAAASCIQCRTCSEICPRHLLGHPFETHRVMRAFGAGVELKSENGKLALLCCDCGVCEHISCPMGLSPRRINQSVKNALRGASITYDGDRQIHEDFTRWREYRRVAVPRLVARLNISQYMDLPFKELGEVSPKEVHIPLRQHIGAAAQAVVKVGDHVTKGTLIGEIPEKALGARIHASISGSVREITNAMITIVR